MTIGIALFLILIFALDSFILMPRGSDPCNLVTSKVRKGQLWRPVTSMFLHAGIPFTLSAIVPAYILIWVLFGV